MRFRPAAEVLALARVSPATVAGFIVAMAAASSALAGQLAVRLDPVATKIEFTLSATLHTVHGELKLKQGVLQCDTATQVCTGQIVVDALSAATGNDGRDKKMHHDVLESAVYPQIVFVPAKLTGAVAAAGESTLTIAGTLTLHGREHAQSWTIRVAAAPDGTFTAATEFRVPFVEWGLTDPSAFVLRVAKEVVVTVTAAGRLEHTGGP